MQSDNTIWSSNRVYQELFFLKNYAQYVVEKLVPDPNLPASFSAGILKKNISHVIFY